MVTGTPPGGPLIGHISILGLHTITEKFPAEKLQCHDPARIDKHAGLARLLASSFAQKCQYLHREMFRSTYPIAFELFPKKKSCYIVSVQQQTILLILYKKIIFNTKQPTLVGNNSPNDVNESIFVKNLRYTYCPNIQIPRYIFFIAYHQQCYQHNKKITSL